MPVVEKWMALPCTGTTRIAPAPGGSRAIAWVQVPSSGSFHALRGLPGCLGEIRLPLSRRTETACVMKWPLFCKSDTCLILNLKTLLINDPDFFFLKTHYSFFVKDTEFGFCVFGHLCIATEKVVESHAGAS